MGDWDERQQQFIQKLDKTEALFQELFEKDADGLIIRGEDRDALRELRRRNGKILDKLKSKEFTVAVVGLEKAGKSTLGNALIKSLVLPEYAERCTYTTTEIRSGNVDEAVVSFYSRAEFNERFKDMFRAIEYPGDVDFSTMRLATFKKYWAEVEADPNRRGLFQLHDGKTTEDIQAILEGRDELTPLLDRPDKKFAPSDWSTFDFKIYITGIAGETTDENGNVSIIRKPHPYAVKNVIIRSTQLGDMKNIVLYDVPGFDSPTELHKQQTENMLKEADAIILVTNVGDRPNLTGTQLDMLRKGSDIYGVRLSEKAFVFGNKIDSALNLQTAKNNLNALRKDVVEKFKIASDDHVLGGSARAYLEAVGLIKEVVAKKTLDEWQLSDGIGELHHQMQTYYDHDRYAVLKKRAESTLGDAEKFLRDLLERYTPDILERLENGGEYLLHSKDKLSDFIEQANELIKERLGKIRDEAPFSTELVNNIDKIYPLVGDAYAPLVKQIENSLVIDPDDVYPTTTVNGIVRQRLQVEFLKNIVSEVARLTEGRQAEIRNELVENFLENMEMPTGSQFRAELEQSVNKLFDELLIDGGAQCYFNPLVERFTTTLMEALILSPFAEEERFKKVQLNLPEFISLAVYCSASGNVDEQKIEQNDSLEDRMKFFSKILTHEGTSLGTGDNTSFKKPPPSEAKNAVNSAENFKLLKDFFVSIDERLIGKWSKKLTNAGVQFDAGVQKDFQRRLNDKCRNLDWDRLSVDQRMNLFEEVIDQLCLKKSFADRLNFDLPKPPPTKPEFKVKQLSDLHRRGKELKTMRSKEDMIATLDADIVILRDITVKAVIKAIGLERAFISVIAKNVNLIRDALDKKPDGRDKFNVWIQNNIHKIKEHEFTEINAINRHSETRRRIVEAVQQVLAKM